MGSWRWQHVEEVLRVLLWGWVPAERIRKLCKVVASRVLGLTGLVCGKIWKLMDTDFWPKHGHTAKFRGVEVDTEWMFLTSNEWMNALIPTNGTYCVYLCFVTKVQKLDGQGVSLHFFFPNFIYFGYSMSLLLCMGFLWLCLEQGYGLFCGGMGSREGAGFSSSGVCEQLWQLMGHMSLVALHSMSGSLDRDWTYVLCTGRQAPNHQSTGSCLFALLSDGFAEAQ